MLRSCGICLSLNDFRVRILNKDAEVRMEGEAYVQVQEKAVQTEVEAVWSSMRSRWLET